MPTRPLDDLGPLYHDYSLFGVSNLQLPGIYRRNQYSKAYILRAYIQYAIAKCKTTVDEPVSFAELFCADGYYAMVARHLGATSAIGIDNDREGHLAKAPEIAARLGITSISFVRDDVNHLDTYDRVDIVANVGGLYHVANPRDILMKSHTMARRYLIVQSVVSMAVDSQDYFESPAPGWTWGSRFSQPSFDRMIEDLGYDVIDRDFNELEGNDRPQDRGSVYYLIKAR